MAQHKQMRSVAECNAKVAEMVLMVLNSPDERGRADYLALAESWRHVTNLARWQDHDTAPMDLDDLASVHPADAAPRKSPTDTTN